MLDIFFIIFNFITHLYVFLIFKIKVRYPTSVFTVPWWLFMFNSFLLVVLNYCCLIAICFLVCLPWQNRSRMPRVPKADAKPRGRMTAYAFFVQICREEHKKKHPEENVVFSEFSKKCAERWKVSPF